MNGEKQRIRERFLKKRALIGEEERMRQSEAILQQLSGSSFFGEAETVLAFSPLPDEVDISAVRLLCEETGKRIAYPKVSGENMDFYEILPGEELREGAFHVMEPVVTDGREPLLPECAICLTPGAAFDGFGNRYGYGRGYYDRYFNRFPGLIRIGVCFTEQISQKMLPVSPQDVKINYLLTERGIAMCDVQGKIQDGIQ